jgi:hypothetical protein
MLWRIWVLRHVDMLIKPERVWRAIQAASTRNSEPHYRRPVSQSLADNRARLDLKATVARLGRTSASAIAGLGKNGVWIHPNFMIYLAPTSRIYRLPAEPDASLERFGSSPLRDGQ